MTHQDFHPDFRRVAPLLPKGSLVAKRFRLMRGAERLRPPDRPARGVEVERLGPITMRLHRARTPDPQSRGALLWIHGGGYVIGTSRMDEKFCARVANELGILVVSVDYRRAPEHPFPTPLHDCYDALQWLASRPDVDPARIAIGGASAGAGLTAALALLARDRGEIRPAFQLLSYPMLDDRTATRTDLDESRVRMWNNESNRFGWTSYLGNLSGAPAVSGLAVPARHDDLRDLAPAWIGVGTFDLFHDEDVAYARRLREAGVSCELDVIPGAFHGFDVVFSRAGVSREYRDTQVRVLGRALGATVS
jgi:acetyl esterase/lipase